MTDAMASRALGSPWQNPDPDLLTEERLDASEPDLAALRQSPWWGVHASRYHFASTFIRGRRVLDVACGTGYGLSILAQRAELVVGADTDLGAVRKARAGGRPVLVGDCGSLPFADGSFEFVTSLETLEHLEERDRFLAEVRRVIAASGTFVLSTPNALVTQPIDGKPRNPFHVHEYTPEELRAALRAHFSSVDLVGQTLSPRYRISPFWDDQRRLPLKPGIQARLFIWRVLNKFPFRIRDAVSNLFSRQPFVPGEFDYVFDADAATAPVLVAICRDVAK